VEDDGCKVRDDWCKEYPRPCQDSVKGLPVVCCHMDLTLLMSLGQLGTRPMHDYFEMSRRTPTLLRRHPSILQKALGSLGRRHVIGGIGPGRNIATMDRD